MRGIMGRWVILAMLGSALLTACAGAPPPPSAEAWTGPTTDLGCGPRPVPNAVERPDFDTAWAAADLIFAGKVRATHDPIPLSARVPNEDLVLDREFEVIRLWKGTPDSSLTVRAYRAMASGGCDLTVGNIYLVFAVENSPHFWTSRCSRTALISGAYADLYKLGEPAYDDGSRRVPEMNSEYLARDLLSAERTKRVSALRILEQIAPDDPSTIQVILEGYAKQRGTSRIDFVSALGRLGSHGAPAVPALIQITEDDDATVRGLALSALGKIGPVDDRVVPTLIRALGDPDPAVRSVAAQGLGVIGPAAAEAAPALRELLNDPEERVRTIAARALQILGGS